MQAAHAVFYTFGTLHWRAQGLSADWCGALWAISIVVEIGLFAFSRRGGASASAPSQLIALGAAAGGGALDRRWASIRRSLLLVPLQVLHGLTFGAAHLGAIHFMARTVPEGQAGTAQALYASVDGGVGMGAAMLLAGPLYADFGGRAYWAMAALAASCAGREPRAVARLGPRIRLTAMRCCRWSAARNERRLPARKLLEEPSDAHGPVCLDAQPRDHRRRQPDALHRRLWSPRLR